jgi:hypothetical protein
VWSFSAFGSAAGVYLLATALAAAFLPLPFGSTAPISRSGNYSSVLTILPLGTNSVDVVFIFSLGLNDVLAEEIPADGSGIAILGTYCAFIIIYCCCCIYIYCCCIISGVIICCIGAPLILFHY